MKTTSFHGNKTGVSAILIVAITFCSVVGTYRLKKISEIKLWEKSLLGYSYELEQKNQTALEK